MEIILCYRRGSFAQSETLGSLDDAIGRACELLLEDNGCTCLQIEQDGKTVLTELEILAKCAPQRLN